MAERLMVRDMGATFWYIGLPSMPRVVAMLAERPGVGMLGGGRSGKGRCSVSTPFCACSGIFWSSAKPWVRDCGLPDVESPEGGAVPLAPAAAAAAAACCCAMSFLDALPRFLRSRTYSHVKPNSVAGLALLCFARRHSCQSSFGGSLVRPTHTVCTRRLAVTLGPQLVALIAGTADAAPDRP